MIPAIYAELRKLLSVRSTYVTTVVALVIIGIFAFYGAGYKGGPRFSPDALFSTGASAATVLGIFLGILGILLITHEYRYNTIAYTLTSTNNRLKVLAAKMLVIGAFAAVTVVIAVFFAVILMSLGANMAGSPVSGQEFNTLDLLWKALVYAVTGAWLGLLLGFIARNQVFAIVLFFILPNIEGLLNTMLKVSTNYLPFSAHNQILVQAAGGDTFSPAASTMVLIVYLAVGAVAAGSLFLKRDAA